MDNTTFPVVHMDKIKATDKTFSIEDFGGKHALDTVIVDSDKITSDYLEPDEVELKDKLKPVDPDVIDIAPPTKRPFKINPPEVPKKRSACDLGDVIEELEEM